MKSQELRQKYLKFFQDKGHKIIPSASLVPPENVELAGTQRVLFTTAGMHPLVPYLLGQFHPQGKRLVNVQRCLRTDDIDDVGDSVHNTFFEMLGNWSLGDPASPDGIGQGGYWKEETISWSFDFLINHLKLDSKRIYVSVFAGDADAPFDQESFDIWRKLGVGQDHIFKYPKSQNWWGPIGETGPCGPDTEMFYDMDPKKGKIDPAGDPDRFVEIWNDVFMQYDRKPDGSFKPLKQKNVDTGMGLERMLMVLQGKESVYETDLFTEAMDRLLKQATNTDINYLRKTADHTRAVVFLLADGVPVLGQDPRGSVLNNFLNNSFAYLRHLGIEHSYLSHIAEAYINVYENVYPEIKEKKEWILSEISRQEERYLREIMQKKATEEIMFKSIIAHPDEQNLKKINEHIASVISGASMPYHDLQNKYNINTTVSGTIGTVSAEYKQNRGIAVEDSLKVAEKVFIEVKPPEPFIQQEALQNYKAIMALHSERSRKTTKKEFKGGLASHSAKVIAGHTATHLLHQALRDVLGNHVHQTGSNITEERIRFDFSHGEKLTDDQIKKVQTIVNQKVSDNLTVHQKNLPKEAAQEAGAIGLFEQKYGDLVSVYYIGSTDKIEDAYSKEFCGGPHVKSTGELGDFKIIKEESAGSGTRRIYATINPYGSDCPQR